MVKKSIKIHQKSIKNRSKIDQKSIKLALGPQEAPRGPQEPSKSEKGTKGTPRGHRLGEGFWEGFGAMLAPRATKKPFKMHSKFSSFLMSIFHRFWRGFGRVLGAMLASKRHWKLSFNTDWIFDRFFIDFYGFWKARILIPDKQSTRNPFFSKFAILLIFQIFIDFGSHVGFQNPPKIHKKSIKNLLKKRSNIRHLFLSIFYRFWTHLGLQVGLMLGLCWL